MKNSFVEGKSSGRMGMGGKGRASHWYEEYVVSRSRFRYPKPWLSHFCDFFGQQGKSESLCICGSSITPYLRRLSSKCMWKMNRAEAFAKEFDRFSFRYFNFSRKLLPIGWDWVHSGAEHLKNWHIISTQSPHWQSHCFGIIWNEINSMTALHIHIHLMKCYGILRRGSCAPHIPTNLCILFCQTEID